MPVQVVDIPTTFRTTAAWPVAPSTGAGVEMAYQSSATPATGPQYSLFVQAQYVPGATYTDVVDTNLGMQFKTDSASTLNAIWYYRPNQDSLNNPNTHQFAVYRSDTQALLWTGSSNNDYRNDASFYESGWNQILVPNIPLQANVNYMIVLHSFAGIVRMAHVNGLSGRDTGILHPTGCFWQDNPSIVFPTNSSGMDFMGLDVLVTGPAQGNYQIYGPPFDPTVDSRTDQNYNYNVGQNFQTSVPVTLNTIRFYRSSSDTSPTSGRQVGIFNRFGHTLLWQGTTSGEVSGWNNIATPAITLLPGVDYMVAYHEPSPGWNINVWGIPPGPGYSNPWYPCPMDNGPIRCSASFMNSGTSFAMPTSYFGSNWLGLDIIVSVNATPQGTLQAYDRAANAAGALQVVASSLTLNAPTAAPQGLTIGTYTQQYPLTFLGPNPDQEYQALMDMSYAIGVGQDGRQGNYFYVKQLGVGGAYADCTRFVVLGGASTTQLYLWNSFDLSNGGGFRLDSTGAMNCYSTGTGTSSQITVQCQSPNGNMVGVIFTSWSGNNLTLTLPATVAIAGQPYTSRSLTIGNLSDSATYQAGIGIFPYAPGGASQMANLDLRGIFIQTTTNYAGASTVMYGLLVASPSIYSGNTWPNVYGVYVQKQGATGVTNAYGIYIAAQSGASSTNIGLYNAGTTTLNLAVTINSGLSVGNNLTVAGTTAIGSRVWIGTATTSDSGLIINLPNYANWSGSTLYGINMQASFGPSASSTIYGVYVVITPNAGLVNSYGMYVATPVVSAGNPTNSYGMYVANQGVSPVFAAYGLYIAAQSGATNTNLGLYNVGTTRLDGAIGVGVAPTATAPLIIAGTWSVPGSGYAVSFKPVYGANALGVWTLVVGFSTANSVAITGTNNTVLYIDSPALGTSSTVTYLYGVYVSNQGKAGITNAYGVSIAAQSGASNTNMALLSGGPNWLQGITSIGANGPVAGYSLTIWTPSNTSSDNALQVQNTASTVLFKIRSDGLIAFFGGTGSLKPTVTGAKGSNAALGSLMTALAGLGLVTDSTTA